RLIGVTGGGVDDQSRRLVDDHDVSVFVQDDQREVLRGDLGRDGRGNVELDLVAADQTMRRFRNSASGHDQTPFVDQASEETAAVLRQKRRETAVDASAVEVV